MRCSAIVLTLLAACTAASACGGKDSSSSGGTPTTPGTVTPAAVTVSIVATQGNKSYVPNPVSVATAEQVVFKNNDTVVHHIVMDDGSVDFGNLSPGASSQARSVSGGNFHCANHPSMVGSINGTTAPDPAPGSGDGY
jgi:plastocyanin